VVIVDNLYNSSEVALDRIELICGKRPVFHKADVTDEAALEKVFAAHPEIDSVIHFAALKVCNAIEAVLMFLTGPRRREERGRAKTDRRYRLCGH